jgi:hypothetical protein
MVGEPLGEALKTTVVVENRPGANGALAAMYVARSAPDGYTLLMATNSPLSAVPFMMRKVPYDPIKDFTPVTRMGSFTLMLVMHPSIPAQNVKELIAYAKANPGKLSFASANTSGIVAGETLKHWAGIDILHVPYKSAPPALQDLIAGRVSMMGGHQERVAIRRGARDVHGGERTVRAGAILHHDGRLERLAERLADHTADRIAGAAGAENGDEVDRSARIVVGMQCRTERHHPGGQENRKQLFHAWFLPANREL